MTIGAEQANILYSMVIVDPVLMVKVERDRMASPLDYAAFTASVLKDALSYEPLAKPTCTECRVLDHDLMKGLRGDLVWRRLAAVPTLPCKMGGIEPHLTDAQRNVLIVAACCIKTEVSKDLCN